MANMGGAFHIKVRTEELKRIAGDTGNNVTQLMTSWDEVMRVVRNTRIYWRGDGADTKRKELETLDKDVQRMALRLREDNTDLQKTAGIYEGAEKDAVSISSGLPVDVIF